MDKGKSMGGSVGGNLGNGASMLFPSQTRFTYAVRQQIRLKTDTLNHLLVDHVLDTGSIQMSKSPVPECQIHRTSADKCSKVSGDNRGSIQDSTIFWLTVAVKSSCPCKLNDIL